MVEVVARIEIVACPGFVGSRLMQTAIEEGMIVGKPGYRPELGAVDTLTEIPPGIDLEHPQHAVFRPAW